MPPIITRGSVPRGPTATKEWSSTLESLVTFTMVPAKPVADEFGARARLSLFPVAVNVPKQKELSVMQQVGFFRAAHGHLMVSA